MLLAEIELHITRKRNLKGYVFILYLQYIHASGNTYIKFQFHDALGKNSATMKQKE